MSDLNYPCPECGCCCDYDIPCCDQSAGGNPDHLGERGGCKRLDPGFVPAEYRVGPCRPCGHFGCTGIFCTAYKRCACCNRCCDRYYGAITQNKKPAGAPTPTSCGDDSFKPITSEDNTKSEV